MPWLNVTGEPDRAAVHALVAGGDPRGARGADLHAAALELAAEHPASRISSWLGVPLLAVREWLREDR